MVNPDQRVGFGFCNLGVGVYITLLTKTSSTSIIITYRTQSLLDVIRDAVFFALHFGIFTLHLLNRNLRMILIESFVADSSLFAEWALDFH